MNHYVTPPELDRIRQLVAEGMTDERIGKTIGFCRDTVFHIRKDNGIPGQRPGRPRRAR